MGMADPPGGSATGSDGVALEAPIVALTLLEHLPECALPLASLLVLFLDPERHLHHAPRDVPVAPQGLHGLVVVARPGGLVEERAPGVLVLADELDLLKRILRLPLLDLLPDLPDRGLRRHGHCEHAKRRQHLYLGHVVLVALRDLRRAFLDQPALLVPDLAVRRRVLGEDNLLPLLLSHGGRLAACGRALRRWEQRAAVWPARG